jgi:chromate reductase
MLDEEKREGSGVPRLLGISGSLRRASTNTKLVHEAARAFGPCTFTLGDIRLPLYDGDLEKEEGIPSAVQRLADQILAADAVVISTPEYNKNLPGVLKNALDWLSRTKPAPLAGKPVAIVSAAAGRAGGERSQFSLRHCLTPFQPRILQGPEVMIAASAEAFDADGRLKDQASFEFLGRLMAKLRDEMALVTA